ncbi:Ribosome_biogenesis protein ERB1 [Hexamita inflata]|uniref:Ribosome biogenesis protein ERB1 n=1 Tax=Hexamita inflata TaxID=28002 RepID=A0AA86UBN7_9EUKA|nr:Ribosome biogenesis protein ERB1 [Hexamita inflata]
MSESSSDTLSTQEEVRNEEVSNPSSFEISEPTEDSSEDDFLNRALPNEEVQGYDVHGQVIELPAEKQPGERLQEYMDLQQNPSLLFKRVLDKNTGRMVELTDEQLQKLDNLLKYNKTFTKIDIQERPELKFIDNTYKFSIYANNLPTKSQFCRKEELKRVAYFAKLIAQGKLDPDDVDQYKAKLKAKLDKENEIVDIWEQIQEQIQYKNQKMAENQAIRMAPAPKQAYPQTQDSYNPPDEYLQEGQQRCKSLRTLRPETQKLIQERFNRQVDLFLAPRMRSNINQAMSSDEYLQSQLQLSQKQLLKPHPMYCDMVIRSHTGRVNSVSISPNNKFIASGGKDGILRIFELATGKLLKQIALIRNKDLKVTLDKYYNQEIFCVKFCPLRTVSVVACACANQIVFVDLQLSMGLNLQDTKLNTRNLLNVDVSKVRPNKGWKWECLQGTVTNETELIVVNPVASEIDEEDPRFDNVKYQLNHNQKPENVTIYTSLNSDVLLRIHSPNTINQIDFHQNGDYLLSLSNTTSRKTNLSIHRLSTGQSSNPFAKALPIQSAVFSLTSASLIVFEQTTGFSFNLKTLVKENEFHPHIKQIQKCAINAATNDLVVSGSTGAVALFRFCAGPESDSRNHFSQIQTACVDCRYNLVAVGGEDGIIQVMRIIDGKMVSCIALAGHGVKNQIGVRGVAWGSGGELVSCAGDGTIRIWR